MPPGDAARRWRRRSAASRKTRGSARGSARQGRARAERDFDRGRLAREVAPLYRSLWGTLMRVLHVYAGNLYGGVESMLATFARVGGEVPEMETRFALAYDGRLAGELRDGGAPSPSSAARGSAGRGRCGRCGAASPPPRGGAAPTWRSSFRLEPRHLRSGGAACRRARGLLAARRRLGRRGRGAGAPHRAGRGGLHQRVDRETLRTLFPDGAARRSVHPRSPPPDARAERAAVRAELGVDEDAVVIVQASRMEPWKGHRPHLEALARLGDRPRWSCWMAGGAQRPHELRHAEEMRALAERLGIGGRVRWLGERADVPRLLAAADLLCQPNLGPEPLASPTWRRCTPDSPSWPPRPAARSRS